MAESNNDKSRPLGMLPTRPLDIKDLLTTEKKGFFEAYMNHRHDLNMYTAVAISALFTKTSPASKVETKPLVYAALKSLILKHPSLALLIHGPSTDNPEFHLAETVDLTQMVIWSEEGLTTQDQEQALVTKYLTHPFKNVDKIPPWRLLVCPRGSQALSVSFVFHHSIGDGTSGKIFLTDLADALNTAVPDSSTTVTIPTNSKIPPSLEMISKLQYGFFFLVNEFAKKYGIIKPPTQGVWAGTTLALEAFNPPIRVQTSHLSLEPALIKTLAAECRRRQVSVSALIAALAVVAVDTAVPSDAGKSLAASLPRNLRPVLAAVGEDDMGVYVTGMTSVFERAKLRSASPAYMDRVWAATAQITKVIKASIALRDWNSSVGKLRNIPNMRSYIKSLVGTPATSSVDISTLLINKPPTKETDVWAMDDISFTQSPNLFRSALVLNSIGFKGEKLNVSFVWASEVLSDELAAQVVDQFKKSAEELGASVRVEN